MTPYGSDRIRVMGERVFLSSRIDKNWVARTRAKGTHAEFPGTTVLWDGQSFEVVSVEKHPGFFRYVLEPWRDEHTIRIFEDYNAETEQAREVADRAERRRHKQRFATRLLALFLGHLPAAQQDRLENELGIFAPRMTMISTILPVLAVAAALFVKVESELHSAGNTSIPTWVWIVLYFMFLDSILRFSVAFLQNRPMGSLPGIFAYILYYYVFARDRARLASPFAAPAGQGLYKTEPPTDVERADAVATAGGYLTLLTPEEQQRIAARYPYDYREHATGVAMILLVFSVIGAVSLIVKLLAHRNPATFLALLVAVYFVVEQIHRLLTFPRRPAGSILGVVVRPFMRRFLEQ